MRGWSDLSFGAFNTDGVRAAVPLLVHAGSGDSVPPSGYGGIFSTRTLEDDEQNALIEMLWRNRNLRALDIRWLESRPTSCGMGTVMAMASIVFIAGEPPPAERYTRLARRSIKRALTAGATVERGTAEDFLPTYLAAARKWATRYPEALIRSLVVRDDAVVHAVKLHNEVLAVLLTLVRGSHWMCWLAAQTEEGRRIAASYLAYDAVFREAFALNVPFVNLGASAGGGSEFKHHLGAVEIPMRRFRRTTRRNELRERIQSQLGRAAGPLRWNS